MRQLINYYAAGAQIPGGEHYYGAGLNVLQAMRAELNGRATAAIDVETVGAFVKFSSEVAIAPIGAFSFGHDIVTGNVTAVDLASAGVGGAIVIAASRGKLRPVAAESNTLRFAGSRGVRNADALSNSQQEQIFAHVDELGLSRSDFHISSKFSAYSDNFDVVFIGPNAFQAPTASRIGGTVFERLSPRAVVAHEAGHMITTRAGTSFAPGSLADEIGANLTGRQLPGLTNVERYQLLRDAAERARIQGTSVRNVLRGN